MSLKLTFLKVASVAVLAGVAAKQQQKNSAHIKRNLKGCTPCKAGALLDAARTRVRNGHL
jgi:hypothetical protein